MCPVRVPDLFCLFLLKLNLNINLRINIKMHFGVVLELTQAHVLTLISTAESCKVQLKISNNS